MKKLLFLTKFIFLMIWTSLACAYELTILHLNDHHSHLSADNSMDLKLAGKMTRVQSGGFPAVVQKFKALEARNRNVIKLHAGDAITGDLYFTLFEGEADAALMNEVCFDAYAVGNHEFDFGDTGLAKFLDFLNDGKCKTAVLAANVIPELGASALAKKSANDYLQPYVIMERGGTKIGIIGIDIVSKTTISSSPDPSTKFLDETKTAQKYVNELRSKGINHIILLTHYQYNNDLELAKSLDGVDVIVGGASHSLLGDFSELGLNPAGPYPTVSSNRSGQKVCIVQAWQFSQVVGELIVQFDAEGNVRACSGTPHMMLADSFMRKNSDGDRMELEGDFRKDVILAVEENPLLSIVSEDPDAAAKLATFTEAVAEKKAIKIADVAENLCFERIPGQGRSKLCDVSETAKMGSDISNLVAHAFRDMAKASQIAIQNGGGVRIDIGKGDLSIGDAYQLLPFANTLVELDMSGAEIHAVLEDALDLALQPDGSTGAYPYAAGLRWDVDARQQKGMRISNLEFKGPKDNDWVPISKTRVFKVVTNNYIASGKDGYLTFGKVSKEGRVVDTYLDYAQSFVDYARKVGTLKKLPSSEYSTQSFQK